VSRNAGPLSTFRRGFGSISATAQAIRPSRIAASPEMRAPDVIIVPLPGSSPPGKATLSPAQGFSCLASRPVGDQRGAVADGLVTLWIGERMGPVERACLRSMMRHGHDVALYTYGLVDGVPEGVELRNAADVLPAERILCHESGSVALFANWFRYALLRREAGIWVDTDVYLLAPLGRQPDHLFGWEDELRIASGILRLPSDSPVLHDLLGLFERQTLPFWLPWYERGRAWLWRLGTGRTGLERMPWGAAGPRALTALAQRHGVAGEAAPTSRFYPIHYRDARWILDPSRRLEEMIRPDSLSIHLWNELIKGWKEDAAPAGSFLARLQAEGR
jgi:hypothetical protein